MRQFASIALILAVLAGASPARPDSPGADWGRRYGDLAARFPDSYRTILEGYNSGILSLTEAQDAFEKLGKPTGPRGKT
ncbi:MAG: hypothetical protein HY039_09680 [Nitrospirae bacterium]|nr:hypothetical protein [Nitrospirota bacterium]